MLARQAQGQRATNGDGVAAALEEEKEEKEEKQKEGEEEGEKDKENMASSTFVQHF